MYFDLQGRVALLTGPDGNLGPIWHRLLAANGALVYGVGLPQYDLSVKSEVKRSVRDCLSEYGPPDILVLNAAIDNPPGSNANFFGNSHKIIDLNLHGTVDMVEEVLPFMASMWTEFEKTSNIVFIGSMLGFVASDPRNYSGGFDKPWAYGASKDALWNFCMNLAVRYASKGVICNMLALSAVDGKQSDAFKDKYREKIPIRRMLEQQDFEKEFLCCVTARVPYDEPLFVGGGWTLW